MAVFRYLYGPLYFFGFVGGATALVSSDSSPAWLFVLIIASIGTSLAAERIAPFENQWNSSHGDGRRDILHALVNDRSTCSLYAASRLSYSHATLRYRGPTFDPRKKVA